MKEKRKSKWSPRVKTGKTQFNREKKPGESWTDLREKIWGPKFICTEKWC